MEIFTLEQIKNKKVFSSIIQRLQAGEIIVYPTETAYGLGCDPKNKHALQRIYDIKRRDASKLLPLIASSTWAVRKYFTLNNYEKLYAQKNWPGPFTMILHRKSMRDGLKLDYDQVAVRVSGSELSRHLARRLGGLIISTSANISGAGSLYTAKDVLKSFDSERIKPDIIIDAGKINAVKKASQIVIFEGEKQIILRK